ncbi:MAG TPA: EI24 domain-containing protein [Coleofasciculaceae cyanobacterium]
MPTTSPMHKVMGGFGLIAGATYPFRVLAVFWRKPQLWGYVAVPILVNFVIGTFLYAGFLFFGWDSVTNLTSYLSHWFENLIANLPTWLSFLEYLIIAVGFLLHILLVIGLLLLIGFILVQFGVLLGAPWYGKLSEKLEELRTGQLQVVEVGIVRDISRAILYEVKKLVLAVIVGLLLLLLNFVPGVGTVATTVGGITLAAIIVCLDFLDAPMERRRLRFRDKLRMVLRSFPASASFSLVCLGLVSIPLLNLLTIPLCVASGTLFFCDRVSPKLPKLPSPPSK